MMKRSEPTPGDFALLARIFAVSNRGKSVSIPFEPVETARPRRIEVDELE